MTPSVHSISSDEEDDTHLAELKAKYEVKMREAAEKKERKELERRERREQREKEERERKEREEREARETEELTRRLREVYNTAAERARERAETWAQAKTEKLRAVLDWVQEGLDKEG